LRCGRRRRGGIVCSAVGTYAAARGCCQLQGHGRAGSITYFEDFHEASFGWELGAADVLFIITGPPPQDWDKKLPWAIGRREEVLSRIAREIIRTNAPQCSLELTDGGVTAVIRKRGEPRVPPN
jgi:hypothetical protein